jgi:hypothetical protein
LLAPLSPIAISTCYGPRIARELSFPVGARLERRGKLLRLFVGGPAYFSRERTTPSELNITKGAPGCLRKIAVNRSEHGNGNERRTELASVARETQASTVSSRFAVRGLSLPI